MEPHQRQAMRDINEAEQAGEIIPAIADHARQAIRCDWGGHHRGLTAEIAITEAAIIIGWQNRPR